MKIAMLFPYFGKLPEWFNLYLFSCSRNSDIDFIFYTDCSVDGPIPENVKFNYISFPDFCTKVSSILNVNFYPESPYKICDLRPFFGHIFKKDLRDYDFWGYGDIDLVYGDLSYLIKKTNKYDLVTSHADRVAGHFALIRKKSDYTHLCYKIDRWKERLEEEYVYGFDEHDFTSLVYPFTKRIWSAYRRIGKHLGFIYYNFFRIPNLFYNAFSRHYFQEFYTSILPKDGEHWIYDLTTGKIKNPKNIDLPYLHFLFFKKTQFYDAKTYWRDGFWQVGNIDFSKVKGSVIFSNERVVYEKK